MNSLKRVSRVFQSAKQILIDDSSRFIFMSDCHRGDGSWGDNFSQNQNIYFAALTHYYNENYTYIEIGDGDELWENSNFYDIVHIHSDVFWLLSKLYNEGRFYMIFGNHDIVKRYDNFAVSNLYKYFDEREQRYIPLFPNIKVHEGLVLRHRITGSKILVIHGHQGDLFNEGLWRLARFLNRYLWKPIELFGINDPTRAAKNYKKKNAVAKRLTEWAIEEGNMIIAGHNHRPVFAEIGEPPYFNDGSCVHPRCITGIEIADGYIMLVKWAVNTKADGTLFIDREVLAGPRRILGYF